MAADATADAAPESGDNTLDADLNAELCTFINKSPSAFHAVASIRERLEAQGFSYLPEQSRWDVEPGGTYYTMRNCSSILAFRVGRDLTEPCFLMCSSHSDSPTYKVKAVPELAGPGGYLRLNVEGYGGMIDSTWLDRPLSVAGRVMVSEGDVIRSQLVYVDKDLLVIPSVAIHLTRDDGANGGLNKQVDLCPLLSAGALAGGSFAELLAREVGAEPEAIVSFDLSLANRQPAVVWGAADEFVSGPRLDDLQCAFATLVGFERARNERAIGVFACFDNEEVGSGTKQGALSTFMPDALARLGAGLGMSDAGVRRAISRSFLISCDNAHAVHPNHPELYDEGNHSWINGGVVIKEAASQRYTTDAPSRAFFKAICDRAGVPTQTFANRSDKRGGCTLGNLLTHQVSLSAVDVGLAQLAMHSAYETAGAHDTAHLARAACAFYQTNYEIGPEGSIRFL